MAGSAIDHHLRGIGSVAETATVVVLALGCLSQRKRVLPAQPVPISDVKRERQHVVAAVRHLVQVGVGRRTGRAALRGEQLNDDRTLRRARAPWGKACEKSQHNTESRQHGALQDWYSPYSRAAGAALRPVARSEE